MTGAPFSIVQRSGRRVDSILLLSNFFWFLFLFCLFVWLVGLPYFNFFYLILFYFLYFIYVTLLYFINWVVVSTNPCHAIEALCLSLRFAFLKMSNEGLPEAHF